VLSWGVYLNTEERRGCTEEHGGESMYKVKVICLVAIASSIGYVTPVATQNRVVQTYYVDGVNGLDKNLGTTEKLPFKTIDRANKLVAAGDTVLVKNGTYNENLTISTSGTYKKWITFKAFPGHKPFVKGSTGAFNIISSYVKIIGFEITSIAENGIAISGQATGNHHVQILNNKVHDCGCNGIGGIRTDYLTIENNIVYRNSFTAPWMCSGISIYQAQDSDRKPGFHNIVRGNISYSNENRKVNKEGKVTDGNGIIIDDLKHTQGEVKSPKYLSSTLVENNLVFDNGGRGVNIFESERVTVRNNTSFKNSKSKTLYEGSDGEISSLNSDNNSFYNNIAYGSDRSKRTLVDSKSSGNKWDYNLSYNGKIAVDKKILSKRNLVDVDPLFISPSISIDKANFRLRPKSPAINSGTSMSAASIDITGKKRSKKDLGAYGN
jgi:parallel beta-helix repeat protein